MASGITVSKEVEALIAEMKVVKNDAVPEDRIRLVVFDIVDKVIDVAHTYTEKDLECKDVFKCFKDQLKKEECHYILYDCHYETNECSKKEELIFVTWCDEAASIKNKMNYASSKSAIVKALHGVRHSWQFNDLTDCGDEECFASKLGCVTKLEGCCVKHA